MSDTADGSDSTGSSDGDDASASYDVTSGDDAATTGSYGDGGTDRSADAGVSAGYVDVYQASATAANDYYRASVDAYLAGDDVAAYELNQAYLAADSVADSVADQAWSDAGAARTASDETTTATSCRITDESSSSTDTTGADGW